MTSAQTMLMGLPTAVSRRLSAISWILKFAPLAALAAALTAGCATEPRLEQPVFLDAPYDQPQLWAVAPFMNESGVSDIDTAALADALVEQLQDVNGILTVPVNRVIRAMREMELYEVRTAGEAQQLMRVLDIDGLIVGTISAYDPYRPPKIAAAIELHRQPRHERSRTFDTRELSRSPGGDVLPGELGAKHPVAQAAGVFDATNHRTLAQLRAFTNGRHMPESAFGRDIYLVRMDLYAQFVSYRLLHDLLAVERARLMPDPDQRADSAHAQGR